MTAHEDLTTALVAMLDANDRPPCCWPDSRAWWTSDRAEDRARAAGHCHGCTILGACHDAAEETNEKFGVWAGRDRTPVTKWKPRPREATT